MDSLLASTKQKVYLYSLIEGDCSILDSAFTVGNNNKLRMEGKIPYQSEVRIQFEKEGPVELRVIATPGDKIKFKLADKDITDYTYHYINLPTLSAQHEIYEYHIQNTTLRQARFRLLDLLSSDTINAITKKAIQDSIDIYDHSIRNMYEKLVLSNNPYIANYAILFLSVGYNCADNYKSYLLNKFPNYLPLKTFFNILPFPKQSKESKERREILRVIKETRTQLKPAKKCVFADKGNRLDLLLHKDNGETDSLSKYKGKYVLVDFWASWCAPCLKAMPKIIRAKEMFGSDLEICAITLDKSRIPWINAIGKNHLHGMSHYMGIDSNKRMFKDIEALGIKSIPQNYLLGRDGKIIAINLDGDELISKLKEIIEVRHE